MYADGPPRRVVLWIGKDINTRQSQVENEFTRGNIISYGPGLSDHSSRLNLSSEEREKEKVIAEKKIIIYIDLRRMFMIIHTRRVS